MTTFQPQVLSRGTTVFFLVTFYDPNGNVVQPVGAQVNITFPGGTTEIPMLQPGPNPPNDPVQWSAQWDSRGANPGIVKYSIHTLPPTPVAVLDGQFTLTANTANLPSF